MEIRDFHNLINNHELVDLLTIIDDENLFYFKSKYQSVELLAYGNFTLAQNDEIKKTPTLIISTFEEGPKFLDPENYILKIDQEYFLSINQLPKSINTKINDLKIADFIENANPLTSKTEWAKQIDQALTLIKQNQFQKIVLSRDIEFKFKNHHPDNLINSLVKGVFKNNQNDYQLFFKYQNSSFISVTPERLFQLANDNSQLISMALAGSMPLGDENSQHLLTNDKLVREHQLVTNEIAKRFLDICETVEVSDVSLMKLSYIQHRLQTISGKLKTSSIKKIIQALAPTPAVGTLPYQNGIATINQIEKRNRKFYAANFGFTSIKFSEVIVGLRSASLYDDKIVLHSGCGIVAGSHAEDEWMETENKQRPILKTFQA